MYPIRFILARGARVLRLTSDFLVHVCYLDTVERPLRLQKTIPLGESAEREAELLHQEVNRLGTLLTESRIEELRQRRTRGESMPCSNSKHCSLEACDVLFTAMLGPFYVGGGYVNVLCFFQSFCGNSRCEAELKPECAAHVSSSFLKSNCQNCRKWGHPKDLRRCGGCAMRYFCSDACMREFWPKHRAECAVLRTRRQQLMTPPSSRVLAF